MINCDLIYKNLACTQIQGNLWLICICSVTNVLVWKTMWRWKRRVCIYFQICRIGITPKILPKQESFLIAKILTEWAGPSERAIFWVKDIWMLVITYGSLFNSLQKKAFLGSIWAIVPALSPQEKRPRFGQWSSVSLGQERALPHLCCRCSQGRSRIFFLGEHSKEWYLWSEGRENGRC